MPAPPAHLGIEILNAARRWARARVILRRVLDSKKATPADVEARKRQYNKTSTELEVVVGRLERALQAQGNAVPMTRRAPPFPWEQLFNMLATGVKEATDARPPGAPIPVKATIIDAVVEPPDPE